MTVSEFLYEFVEKYGAKRWVASTYDGNVGLLENYVHPYLGDKKLKSIRTKTVDDYYDFLLEEAEPAANMGRQRREHVTVSTVHDIHKVVRCAFNLAVKWITSVQTRLSRRLFQSTGNRSARYWSLSRF